MTANISTNPGIRKRYAAMQYFRKDFALFQHLSVEIMSVNGPDDELLYS